jgi:glycine/D-amino acid oxidase-like deaminating enzyme/nitrite reductase/ring-hydroxylating ferredoxin subunit
MPNDPDAFRPVWLDEAPADSYPRLHGDHGVDVAVIGAGITGLTLALLLQREGRHVAVLDRGPVARAGTAHTSGHLTAVPDISFSKLIAHFGESGASTAVRAGMEALETMESLCRATGADAGFLRVPAFRWSARARDQEELQHEAELAARLGLRASLVDSTPLPFPVAAAIRFEDQALFQPVSYAAALARAFTAAGGALYTDTPVERVEAGEPCRVHAGGHVVHAADVVHATQTPVGRMVGVQARLTPVTSYVLVARLASPAPAGLFWDTDEPYHYLRPLHGGSDRIVAGGSDHKTGQAGSDEAFARLEAWLDAHFGVTLVERRWSFGLFEPADGLPYIGAVGGGPEWVMAGFAGVGLAYGTAAALLIRDEILGNQNPAAELLAASRVKPLASAAEVVKENASNAWRLVRDRLAHADAGDLAHVAPGEGRLVDVEGHKAAVHRDEAGRLHVLSPTCTHLGCIVHWNAAASTWDCPCHGGRYLPDGRVLYGPPTEALAGLESRPAPQPARGEILNSGGGELASA